MENSKEVIDEYVKLGMEFGEYLAKFFIELDKVDDEVKKNFLLVDLIRIIIERMNMLDATKIGVMEMIKQEIVLKNKEGSNLMFKAYLKKALKENDRR